MNDLRYSIRVLLKNPAFTALALITLALGIGVNTAIFSVVDSVLLRPLPLKDPDRVVSIWEHGLRYGGGTNEMAPANYFDLRNQSQAFEDVGAFGDLNVNLTGEGEPERIDGQLVTANVFKLLGVEPALGRTFSPDEDRIGHSKYSKPEQRRAFYDEVLRKVEELPGVESAGMISFLPLSFTGMNFNFSIEDRPAPSDMELPFALYRVVSSNYFRAMGIPLERGRFFDSRDVADAPPVILVNRRLAEHFWPNEDPAGKRLKIGPADSPNAWAAVVGVVGDVHQEALNREQKFELYVPYAQERRGFVAPRDLVVRTAGDPRAVAGAVREAVWSVDKDQPVSNVKTMEQVVRTAVSRERFQTLLLALFATLALVLACVGLYGVISYAVVQRTHEIGVRMALGAQPADVLRLVINQGMALTLTGLVLGVAISFAVTRVMSEMLFGVTATDPVTFAGVPVVLGVIAFLACYIPARRATKVDPLAALRYE